ncbi:hypothetical protein O4H61_07320 [Roseovarius aestuarii]|nr:hypothetical protein [Roseovarius aestuarii]
MGLITGAVTFSSFAPDYLSLRQTRQPFALAREETPNWVFLFLGYSLLNFDTIGPMITGDWQHDRVDTLDRMLGFEPSKGAQFRIAPTSTDSRVHIGPHSLAMPYFCNDRGYVYRAQQTVEFNGGTWFVVHLDDGQYTLANVSEFQVA